VQSHEHSRANHNRGQTTTAPSIQGQSHDRGQTATAPSVQGQSHDRGQTTTAPSVQGQTTTSSRPMSRTGHMPTAMPAKVGRTLSVAFWPAERRMRQEADTKYLRNVARTPRGGTRTQLRDKTSDKRRTQEYSRCSTDTKRRNKDAAEGQDRLTKGHGKTRRQRMGWLG